MADDDATPQELAHELKLKYPAARQADIRQGGNYPYIAAYEDFALHTEVRRSPIIRYSLEKKKV